LDTELNVRGDLLETVYTHEDQLEFFAPSLRILLALTKGKRTYHDLFAAAKVSWQKFRKIIHELIRKGLIKSLNDGVYEITDDGIAVLRSLKKHFEVVN